MNPIKTPSLNPLEPAHRLRYMKIILGVKANKKTQKKFIPVIILKKSHLVKKLRHRTYKYDQALHVAKKNPLYL